MAQKTTTAKASGTVPKKNEGKKPAKRKKPVRKKRRKKVRKIHMNIWIAIAILLLIGLCISWPAIRHRSHNEDKGEAVPKGAYVLGIDISHFQPEVEWDSLIVMTDGSRRTMKSMSKAKDIRPVSFVFIKATEGSSMKDKHFRKHWKEAEKRDMRRGAYHFFRSSKDPKQQAENFIKTVGSLRYKDLPPVLDIETIHSGCSYKTLNDKALTWLRIIETHYGRKPIIYSSASFIEDILCDDIKQNYPIWVAHYGVESPRYKDWDLWQFTDKAVVHGIDGYVDLNACSAETLENL